MPWCRFFMLVGLLAMGALVGCGGGGSPVLPVVVTFTRAVMDTGDFAHIQPLGNLNPPGHTFPTDHIYFYFTDPTQTYPVYAPAAATITAIINRSSAGPPAYEDHKLDLRFSRTVRGYLDHVGALDPVIQAAVGALPEGRTVVSVAVAAGQRLGTAGGRAGLYAMDLGTYDTSRTVAGLIHPEKYYDQTRYCTAPLSYYTGDLRTSLYAQVRRTGADKDGQMDLDQAGKLVGNWFAQGAAISDNERQLACVYDPNEPTEVRISMGGELGLAGVYAVPADAPDPATVGQAQGQVAYRLLTSGATQVGLMLVQVTGPETLRVQVFPGSTAGTADFTAAARTYTR